MCLVYLEDESSEFTHWGKRYSVNKLIQLANLHEPENVLMHLVAHCINNDLDLNRVMAADVKIPVIGIRESTGIYILDGSHRLVKLHRRRAAFIRVRFVTAQELLQCLITKE